ncbi:Similar to inx1: Innexin inx1 (Schistocerca americana), partial [Cotesia congregata]
LKMYNLLRGLSTYLKWQDIKTDSMVFRMHNIFTTVLLLMCSMIITATQYVGNPISCIVGKDLPNNVVNTFCWITSTFTMPDAFNRQAMFCYLPHWLWGLWEGGLASNLVMGLNHGLDTKETICKKKNTLMDYLVTHIKSHNMYVYRYFICEVLCVINIFVQLYLMNRFFDGEFMSYGLRVLQFSDTPQEERVDPMVYVFPRVTKCIFHKYGASGTIQTHDSLCILPLNIVNEKTYIFIWFWYIILSIFLVGLMIYRAGLIFMPSVRPYVLKYSGRLLSIETCSNISKKLDLGDWWLLYILQSNMDSLVYRELLEELTKKVGSHISQPVNQ